MKQYLLLVFLFLVATSSYSQTKPPADNKGNDFWFAFPPNFHNNFNNTSWDYDLLYIFIAADEPTQVEINYTDMDGGKFQKLVNIINPQDIETVTFPYRGLELEGWNRSGKILPKNDRNNWNEQVSPASFHVVSEKEISVYIQNQASTTSDATLVYPVDALGKNYYVMSYYSSNINVVTNQDHNTPSQFVIVATEDNTTIDIEPPKGNPTQYHGDEPFTIELNQGDSYLVQSTPDKINTYDLTGTHIVASAPITVLGGHQRAQVPLDLSVDNPSRDYLIQQLIPIESWHKSAFVIPFQNVGEVKNKDLVRVLSASDNNKISIDGNSYKTLNRAEFLELEIDKAINITSSAPMQVVTYAKTTKITGNFQIGDPLMMLIHPKEQFYNKYKFINTQTYENGTPVYTHQYVAVVLPSNGKSSLYLDNQKMNDKDYQPIPNSNYEYRILRVTDGVHEISCDEDIAIYVYGYGSANSYGYIGGMNFKIFDHKNPVVTESHDCSKTLLVISEKLPYDSGIEYFNIDNYNNFMIFQDKDSLPKVLRVAALLENDFLDADLQYTVRDSMGFGYTKSVSKAGFTVGFESQFGSDNKYENPHIDSKLFEEYCFDLKLENYGKYEQEISDIKFKTFGRMYGLEKITLPLTLAPGEVKSFPICVTSDKALKLEDDIIISNNCFDREVAFVSYEFFEDTEAPVVFTENMGCNQLVNITVTDTATYDLGIDDIKYLALENMSIITESNSTYYSAQLSVTNTSAYAWYSISITDKYGNKTFIEDTLKPVFLRLYGTDSSKPEPEEQYFGEIRLWEVAEDSILIENYGSYDQTINYAYAKLNNHFSVPKGQFPLVIPAYSIVGLDVRYYADYVRSEKYRDTIIILADCFEQAKPVSADAALTEYEMMTKCDLPVKITTRGEPYEMYISQPAPTPSRDKVSIRYKANFVSSAVYNIYSNNGSKVKSGNLNISGNEGELIIPLNDISNGQYLLRISNDLINESFVIIKIK